MAQKSQLEKDLGRARITDFKEATTELVGVGTVVEVKNAAGSAMVYTILGAWDGDPERNVISYKTALGAALVGRKPGETVKVKSGGTEEEYSIVAIRRYADQPAG
jgi:transcription elongation GreA/GreB family factor